MSTVMNVDRDFNLEIARYSSGREDFAEAFDCVNEIVLENGSFIRFFVEALAGLSFFLVIRKRNFFD